MQLDVNPAVLSLSPVELDAHPDRERIIATVIEGLDNSGALSDIQEASLDSLAVMDLQDEAFKEGEVEGWNKALDAVDTQINDTIRQMEKDEAMPEAIAALEYLAMELLALEKKK